jgi:hypothetical protein
MPLNDARSLYRNLCNYEGLLYKNIKIGFADISIAANVDVELLAMPLLLQAYKEVEDHISVYPEFKGALTPIKAPDAFCLEKYSVLKAMYDSSELAGVGPMAAVAGAIAQYIGRGVKDAKEIIIENGGDVFLRSECERIVLVYAGNSPLSKKIGIRLASGEWGVCSSAGTFGHSLSFGLADAAIVVSHDAAIADAASTALGNRIVNADSLEDALNYAIKIPGVLGALGIVGDAMGAVGDIELVPISASGY